MNPAYRAEELDFYLSDLRAKALIVTGHAPSEEAGMAYLAEWLRERVPGVPVAHIPHGGGLRSE